MHNRTRGHRTGIEEQSTYEKRKWPGRLRGGEILRLVWRDLALMAGDTACVCVPVIGVGVAGNGKP